MEHDPARYRYWAFISYSHADEAWARWLHKALETYTVPRRLVGGPHPDGRIPQRLYPVFRDRDELPSSHELGAVIKRALQNARYLIVICSPKAAQSRWVEEEILMFKRMGREDRVLALIVDGQPHASDGAGECFPPSLKVRLHADGTLSQAPIEPIAADARPFADHKRGAVLKLIAGMIGVGYDDLVQREQQRRRWRMLANIGVAATILAGMTAIWQWQSARWAQEAQQVRRAALFEAGRRELIKGAQSRAAAYLSAAQRLGEDGPGIRLMLGYAMRPADALLPYRAPAQSPGTFNAAHASADGRWVASVVPDERAVKIWDARTGRPMHSMSTPQGFPMVLYFSADSRWLLLSWVRDFGDYATAETFVWDPRDGRQILRAPGSMGPLPTLGLDADSDRLLLSTPSSLALFRLAEASMAWSISMPALVMASFTHDAQEVVVAEPGGDLVWRAATDGRELRRQATGAGPASTAFSAMTLADGRVLSVPEQGSLKLWDTQGRLQDALCGHSAYGQPVAIAAQTRRVVTEGQDGIKVWSLEPARLLLNAPTLSHQIPNLGSDRDARRLLTLDQDNAATLWDVDNGSIEARLDAHATVIASANFVDQDRRIITTGGDGGIHFWDVAKLGERRTAVMAHAAESSPGTVVQSYGGSFSPAGRYILTSASDGVARVWDGQTGAAVATREDERGCVRTAVWVDEERFLTTTPEGAVSLWSVNRTDPLSRHETGVPKARTIVLSPARDQYLLLGSDPELVWRSIDDGREIARHRDATAASYSVALSPDGAQVLSAGRDGVLWLWRRSDGKNLRRIDGHTGRALRVAFSADGRLAGSSGDDGALNVWDVASGEKLASLQGSDPRMSAIGGAGTILFSQDGERIYSEGEFGGGLMWNRRTDSLKILETGAGIAFWSALSPSEHLFAVSSEDGRVHLFDAHSGALLHVLTAHPRSVARHVSFSADGQRLLSVGQWDHRAKLWHLPFEQRSTDEIAERVRCRVPWAVSGNRLVARTLDQPGCW